MPSVFWRLVDDAELEQDAVKFVKANGEFEKRRSDMRELTMM
jgi:hypothetical protein